MECGCSRESVKRSDLTGWAECGYCASCSRVFWGLRLHLVRTPQGCPSPWRRPGQALIGDRQYYGRVFEHELVEWGVQLLGPARKSEPLRAGFALFEPFRQIIESVDQLQGPDRP